MNGYSTGGTDAGADDNAQPHVEVEFWRRVLQNEPNAVPPVSVLRTSSMTRDECVGAMLVASEWIEENLANIEGDHDRAFQNIVEKWSYLFFLHRSGDIQNLPEWALQVLVVDCWKEVSKMVQRQAAGADTVMRSGNGDGTHQPQSTSVIEIWNAIVSGHLNQTNPVPTVLALGDLHISQDDLAQAVLAASSWVVNNMTNMEHEVAREVLGKWRSLLYPNADTQMSEPPGNFQAWVLRILLVNVWTDVWDIIQMRETGEVPWRS